MTADIFTKSLPKDKHQRCMTRLGMCLIPASKIQALTTYTKYLGSPFSSSHLCGSYSQPCIYGCCPKCDSHHSFTSIDKLSQFLYPILNSFATTIQQSKQFDKSWSGRYLRQPYCTLSKTNQRIKSSKHNKIWHKQISTDFNHSISNHQQSKTKVCRFCIKPGHIQRYCPLNKNAHKKAIFQSSRHQRQPVNSHPSSIKFIKPTKHKKVMCRQHLPRNEKIFHENQTPLFRPEFIKCQTTSFNKTLTANNSKETKITQLIQGVNQNLNEATYKMRILTTYLNLKEQWEVVRKARRQNTDYAANVTSKQVACKCAHELHHRPSCRYERSKADKSEDLLHERSLHGGPSLQQQCREAATVQCKKELQTLSFDKISSRMDDDWMINRNE